MEARALEMLSKILSLHGTPDTEFVQTTFPEPVEDEEVEEDDTVTGGAKKKKKKNLPPFTIYQAGAVLAFFALKNRMIGDREILDALSRVGAKYVFFVLYAPPSQSVVQRVRSLVAEEKRRVYLFHMDQLQFDITTHRMAVPHRILTDEQKRELFEKYKITKPREQLPWIDSQDAMAKWYGAMPDDVLEITRHSDTGGASLYWRYCVADANLR